MLQKFTKLRSKKKKSEISNLDGLCMKIFAIISSNSGEIGNLTQIDE